MHPLSVSRLPVAFGLPAHMSGMSLERRKLASSTLLYASENFFAQMFDLFGIDGSCHGWLQSYYDYPAASSGLNYAAVVHRARMSGDVWEMNRPSTWKEKVLAIQHLNKMLQTKLYGHDLEAVLMVICIFANAEMDPEALHVAFTGPALAIEPLLVPPKEVLIVGQSPCPSPHVNAAAILVQQKGGLHTLTVAGLPEMLAYGDLLQSGMHAAKPLYPSFWKADYTTLVPAMWDWSTPKNNAVPGSGFFVQMIDLLPSGCVACMVRLAKLNQVMGSLRVGPPNMGMLRRLIPTSLALQHQLLSLPPWSDLDLADQAGPQGLYEICRLAAIIYCNAALLAVPPHQLWHVELADQLYAELNEYYASNEPTAEAAFLIWALCVGALATARGPIRDRYEVFLGHLLKRQRVTRRSQLEDILARFLWSEHACRHGLAMLWSSLG